MKVSYSVADRRRAVAEYPRVQSVTKAVRNLGYPARRTLYDWVRYGTARRKPKRTHLLAGNRRYSWQVKLEAVELFNAGYRPKEIQERLDLTTLASVYDWARRFRESGEWGLMTKRERDQHRDIPTRVALEASLPDDPDKLRKLAAQALVDKAVLEQGLALVKKDVSVTVGDLTNRQKPRSLTHCEPPSPCRCCSKPWASVAPVSITNATPQPRLINTPVYANASLQRPRTASSPTGIAGFGGACAMLGSASVKKLSVDS